VAFLRLLPALAGDAVTQLGAEQTLESLHEFALGLGGGGEGLGDAEVADVYPARGAPVEPGLFVVDVASMALVVGPLHLPALHLPQLLHLRPELLLLAVPLLLVRQVRMGGVLLRRQHAAGVTQQSCFRFNEAHFDLLGRLVEQAFEEGVAIDFDPEFVAEVDSDGLELVVPAEPPPLAPGLLQDARVPHHSIPDDVVGEVSESVGAF
jgi:hypothetical protein